jgi:hypothetical protein
MRRFELPNKRCSQHTCGSSGHGMGGSRYPLHEGQCCEEKRAFAALYRDTGTIPKVHNKSFRCRQRSTESQRMARASRRYPRAAVMARNRWLRGVREGGMPAMWERVCAGALVIHLSGCTLAVCVATKCSRWGQQDHVPSYVCQSSYHAHQPTNTSLPSLYDFKLLAILFLFIYSIFFIFQFCS